MGKMSCVHYDKGKCGLTNELCEAVYHVRFNIWFCDYIIRPNYVYWKEKIKTHWRDCK